jgi:non-ribosomal peptide synthetase component E (peptide arylation enzyme)
MFASTSNDTHVPPLLKKLNNYGQQGLKTPIRGSEVGEILQDYQQFTDLLPSSNRPAICDPAAITGAKKPLTHQRLRKFIVEEYDLREFGVAYGQRVAILLPNSAELAVALVATISHWCAAPINATNTWEEIKAELQSTKATAAAVKSKRVITQRPTAEASH